MLLLASVFVMPAGAAAHTQTSSSPQAAALCVTTSVEASPSGAVSSRGYCVVSGRKVASKPVYTYAAKDMDNYSCGAVSGSRASFVVQPSGAAAASGTIRYVPKGQHGKVKYKGKAFTLTSSNPSPDLQCGKLDPYKLPLASTLCPVNKPNPLPGFAVINCGQRVIGGLAFSSPITFVDGTLKVPHVVSPSGRCYYGPWQDGNPGPGPFTDGLGGTFIRQRLLCSDGSGAEVSLSAVILAAPNGDGCVDVIGPWGGERSIAISPSLNLGGLVYVAVVLVSYSNMAAETKLGIESATAVFPLPGTKPPC